MPNNTTAVSVDGSGVQVSEQTLQKVANELGTTVEYVWRTLVEGQFLIGVIDVSIILSVLILTGSVFWLTFCVFLKDEECSEKDALDIAFFMVIVTLVGTGVTGFLIRGALIKIFAPEYSAIMRVVEIVS